MRRFITSITGRIVSKVAIAALLLPSFTLVMATRTSAQLTARPAWAVIPFSGAQGRPSPFGAKAAHSVYDELAKHAESFKPQIEPIDPATVARTEETLGLTDPITDQTSMLRLGQELNASRIVTGQIVDSKISMVGGNRQANVLMNLEVIDVASGVAINGANVQAFSTVRAGNTPNDALINEAIDIAAQKAVGSIQSQSLPVGTVLNTQNDIALVNQGSRSGFRAGQEVIVTRGHDQVATARVFDVDFDSAQIKVDRSIKGIAPGDKVSVVFVPQHYLAIKPDGSPQMAPSRNHGNNSGIISVVLILGLAAVLLGGKGNNGQTAANEVNAEPTFFEGVPANKVTWSTQGFFRYSGVAIRWHIYRSLADTVPIGNVDGDNSHTFYDTNQTRAVAYYPFPPGSSTGTACVGLPGEVDVTGNGVTVGRQFFYRVELVFRVSSLDLPGGGSSTNSTSGATAGGTAGTTGGGTAGTTGGGTGLTGGGTTGGGTTGATGGGTAGTTGGTTGGGTDCFFISSQTTSKGGATAIIQPQLQNPADGATLAGSTPFTFNSVVTLDPFNAQYVLQISTEPSFPSSTSKTKTFPPLITGATGVLSITADPTTFFTSFSGPLWWRIGARNIADFPGPVKDPASKLRYVFSASRHFNRPTPPPPPPGGL